MRPIKKANFLIMLIGGKQCGLGSVENWLEKASPHAIPCCFHPLRLIL
jgi:hypothetical protein